MALYLLMLCFPVFMALQYRSRLSVVAWLGLFVLFTLFIGLRFEVGPDWVQYGNLHYLFGNEDPYQFFLRPESLSSLLFWMSYNSGMGVYLTNIFAAVVMLLGTFSFALRTCNPWLSIVTVTPYFLFVVGMSGVRQGIAAGIALYLLSRWERKNLLKRLLYIVTAALFHTSALVNSLFLVAQMRIPFSYKLLLGAAIALVTILIGSEMMLFADGLASYQVRYIDNAQGVESLGSFYHIGFILIPAIIGFYFRKEIKPYIHNLDLFYFGILAAVALIFVNMISTTGASRLTIYLYFVPMMVFPAVTMIYGGRLRKMTTLGVCLYHMLILVVWFTLSNHHYVYVPYKNILWN